MKRYRTPTSGLMHEDPEGAYVLYNDVVLNVTRLGPEGIVPDLRSLKARVYVRMNTTRSETEKQYLSDALVFLGAAEAALDAASRTV